MNDAAVAPEPPVAPAASQLTVTRTAAGLAIADVARQLKLSPWQVEALETGDYAKLPGPVFVRGFIRNYARLLKMDPAPLLAQIASQAQAALPVEPEALQSAGIPFPGQRRLNWRPYAAGGLLLVAALVGYEFYGDEQAPANVDTSAVELPTPKAIADSVPADAVPAVATESMPAAADAANAGTAVPVRAETAPPAIPQNNARPVEVERAPAPGDQTVRLVFSRESWTEVRDRQGRVLFAQLNSAGSAQTVSGAPPLRLVIGNASGVRILFKDRPVDLAPYTQIDVARLTLE